MVEFLSCHSQSDICNQHNQSYLRLGKSRQVRVTLCRCVKHGVVCFLILLLVITLNSGQNFFEIIFADEPFFCPRKSYRRNRLVFDQALTDWQLILSLSETSLIVSIFAMFNLHFELVDRVYLEQIGMLSPHNEILDFPSAANWVAPSADCSANKTVRIK